MKKILLVDDDPIANFLNKSVVEECANCEVEMAENGQEALDIIKSCITSEDCPDLILLDLNMPIMDGYEFLSAMDKVSVRRKIKIVVLSSSSSKSDMALAEKKKVQGYLTKPLTEDKFQKILNILNS